MSKVYGGQQLNQSSRDSAVYILTIPSYKWKFVGDSLPGQPSGRAGHQCALQGSQLIVMGGLVASDLICDQPVRASAHAVRRWKLMRLCREYTYMISAKAPGRALSPRERPSVPTLPSVSLLADPTRSQYSTPAIIANITGGIGTGNSSSGGGSATGGDGSGDPNSSASNGGKLGGGSGGKSTNLGGIIGGVVGGILAFLLLLLLLLLLIRRRKRERQVEAVAAARDKRGEAVRGDSEESSEGLRGFAYEKTT